MQNRQIHVYADRVNMDKPHLLGILNCIPGRGEEIFSFEYSSTWLESGWLRLLINPGTSLGGARPKASVVDKNGDLWIAKFPSPMDTENKGSWEAVSYKLATLCGIKTASFKAQIFSGKHHTFLTKRFDRAAKGKRIHFASAMTMLQKKDGEDASSGVSYLELVEFLIRFGAKPKEDLEELWKRIVFFICISNTDDHLRNHGFLLTSQGWILSPCYDMNPSDTGDGLKLNISEDDNAQNIDLALQVAPHFRLSQEKAKKLTKEICKQVIKWRQFAKEFKINSSKQDRMSVAFRAVNDN